MSKRSLTFFVDTDGKHPHPQQRPRFRTFKGKDTFEGTVVVENGVTTLGSKRIPGKTIVSAYSPPKNKQAEAQVRLAFRGAQGSNFPPLEGPLEMRCVFVWPLPKSGMLKARRLEIASYWTVVQPEGALLWNEVWSTTAKYPGVLRWKRGDLTNLCKTAEDALNSLAFNDDGQISKGVSMKVYGPQPGVHVWLRELT